MAAFNYTQPTDATGEQLVEQQTKGRHDVFPNFNGQAGTPYNGNFKITGTNEIPPGLLWTAHYAVAGPNTITIQFSTPLLSVSTTTSDYTLTGTGAPSISSVSWSAGSRNILLNLSGSLNVANTYTLAIGARKVASGTQIPYIAPKYSVYNWPNLVVDVIQPATIATTGVGIAQIIDLGDPSMATENAAQGVGIVVSVDMGTPTVNTLIATTGVGIQQDVVLGTPRADPDATCTSVGINQTIGIGTPVIVQEQQPVGVGIAQTITLGTPVGDITPLTPTGVGIAQAIGVGVPVASGPANTTGQGIAQTIGLGLPTVDSANNQETFGVGADQIIGIGIPTSTIRPIKPDGVGIAQAATLGTPFVTAPPQFAGVGIAQAVTFGAISADINPLTIDGVGINQTITVGAPFVPPIQCFGVGVDQTIGIGAVGATLFPLTPRSVGVAQAQAFGTPVGTGHTTITGSGFVQPIGVGTPVQFQVIHAPGIQQDIEIAVPEVRTALNVSASQAAALINLDAALHLAFGEGVEGPVNSNLIDPIEGYADDFTTLQQKQTRTIFEDDAAAAVTAFNIPGAFPATNNTDSASLAKLSPTGATATLTFIDGILVTATVVRNIECIAVGINQTVNVGTAPIVTRNNHCHGVGINQTITVGSPSMSNT